MGLTAEERQKLTAFEAMIKKNNWLEGIDLNNTEAVLQRLKDRFAALDELGHSGELYKEYIALRRKEKEPDVKKAPKSNSASSAAKDIKKPDIKDVKENKNGPVLVKPLRKVKKTLDPNNDDGLKILAQKEDDLKFASEQLNALHERIVNPQDVLTNWDHYADFLGKEEAEDTSKKAAPKITEFTNAPTYYAFENVFSQLKYEFFDRKIEEAENVYGVESDFSDDLKGFNHINEDTLNEEALRRADEFLDADALVLVFAHAAGRIDRQIRHAKATVSDGLADHVLVFQNGAGRTVSVDIFHDIRERPSAFGTGAGHSLDQAEALITILLTHLSNRSPMLILEFINASWTCQSGTIKRMIDNASVVQ